MRTTMIQEMHTNKLSRFFVRKKYKRKLGCYYFVTNSAMINEMKRKQTFLSDKEHNACNP